MAVEVSDVMLHVRISDADAMLGGGVVALGQMATPPARRRAVTALARIREELDRTIRDMDPACEVPTCRTPTAYGAAVCTHHEGRS